MVDGVCGRCAHIIIEETTARARAAKQIGQNDMLWPYVAAYDKETALTPEEIEKWETAGKPRFMFGFPIRLNETDDPVKVEKEGELTRLEKERKLKGGYKAFKEKAVTVIDSGVFGASMQDKLLDALESRNEWKSFCETRRSQHGRQQRNGKRGKEARK